MHKETTVNVSTVDVVVPCYKYGDYLAECVNSILSQSGVAVRVLIIDDASPDDSAAVGTRLAAGDSRVYCVRHVTNQGHIATYNEGLEWCAADYMLLISADDYLLPGALERATSLMNRHPEVSFAFGRAVELQPDGSTETFLTGIEKYDNMHAGLVPGVEFIEANASCNRVPTPTAVVRTSILKKVGGYRADLPHTADMEMWLRLAACGPVGVIGECQAVYRRHANNMSLGYSIRFLPDLEQRKAALDSFLLSAPSSLFDGNQLRRVAYGRLAVEALRQAHKMFGLGEIDTSSRLASFAVSTYPAIKRSRYWVELLCKRLVGHKVVSLLKVPATVMKRANAGVGERID